MDNSAIQYWEEKIHFLTYMSKDKELGLWKRWSYKRQRKKAIQEWLKALFA